MKIRFFCTKHENAPATGRPNWVADSYDDRATATWLVSTDDVYCSIGIIEAAYDCEIDFEVVKETPPGYHYAVERIVKGQKE